MDTIDKIIKLKEKLNLPNRHGVSGYGVYKGVNVRVSDHPPKYWNLVDYSDTHKIIDGVAKFLFILVDSGLNDRELDELRDELQKELEIIHDDVDVEVAVINIDDISEIGYIDYIINTEL